MWSGGTCCQLVTIRVGNGVRVPLNEQRFLGGVGVGLWVVAVPYGSLGTGVRVLSALVWLV